MSKTLYVRFLLKRREDVVRRKKRYIFETFRAPLSCFINVNMRNKTKLIKKDALVIRSYS